MGISGLLPLLKGASTDVHLSKLQGTVAAVDTNGWIHRACYSCADKIYLNEPTEFYVNFCINFCATLRQHNITPILVFDGQSLPAKAETKLLRQKRKQEKREQIEELLRCGQNAKARWEMRQCVDVTFDMVRRVIVKCRHEGIDCLVAPYEADAQMAHLVNAGVADFAITEDSDLLAFGCRRALYKLNRETGRGTMVDLDRLERCFHPNMTFRKFQHMCILSGCDYLANIPAVAIGRAKRFFESISGPIDEQDTETVLRQIPVVLNMVGRINVTPEYVQGFVRARNTFDHQLIYSPRADKLCHLNRLPGHLKSEDLISYAGQFFPDHMPDQNGLPFLTNYVLGNVCPKTLDYLDDYPGPNADGSSNSSIWISEVLAKRIGSTAGAMFNSGHLYSRSRKGSRENENEPPPAEAKGRFVRETCPAVIKASSQSNEFAQLVSQPVPGPTSQYTAVKKRSNLFRKNTETATSSGAQSKYFGENVKSKPLDDSFGDDGPLMDLMLAGNNKRQKTEQETTCDDLQNTSWSSLDEERSEIFLRYSSLDDDDGLRRRRSFRRSDSLSSSVTSVTQSSSAASSQRSDIEPDFVTDQANITTSTPRRRSAAADDKNHRQSKKNQRGSKRKSTKDHSGRANDNQNIRKYFQVVERF